MLAVADMAGSVMELLDDANQSDWRP